MRAFPVKMPWLRRSERYLRVFILFDIVGLDVQVRNLKPMSHILRVKYEHYWFSLLQSDVVRRIRKFFRCDVDPSWFRSSWRRAGDEQYSSHDSDKNVVN